MPNFGSDHILQVDSTEPDPENTGWSILTLSGSLTGQPIYLRVGTASLGADMPSAYEMKVACFAWEPFATATKQRLYSLCHLGRRFLSAPSHEWVYTRLYRDIQEIFERYSADNAGGWEPL